MCLTYMNCMTFDNKQFTDLKKKNGFCGTELVHYTCKVMFFIIKVFDWTIAQVAVRPTTHLLQQTFQVPIRKATFIFKTSTFLFIIQKNDGFFLRCQDTLSVPKIRGMQFLTLHVLPLYRIYIIETYTLDLHAFVMQNILLHML